MNKKFVTPVHKYKSATSVHEKLPILETSV